MQLWTINKRIIDPVCPRHTAVVKQKAVKLRLQDGPQQAEHVTLPKHKKHEAAGVKITTRTQVRPLCSLSSLCMHSTWLKVEPCTIQAIAATLLQQSPGLVSRLHLVCTASHHVQPAPLSLIRAGVMTTQLEKAWARAITADQEVGSGAHSAACLCRRSG